MMTEEQCWRVIERAHASSPRDIERQAELIVREMMTRPVEDILRFGSWVRQKMEDACDPYVLAAVQWVLAANGLPEVSGDTWEYWRGWLVARGRAGYEAVLADPDVLAELFTDFEDFLGGESVEYAALSAYYAATGGVADPETGPAVYRAAPGDESDPPDELFEPSLLETWPGDLPEADKTRDALVRRFPRIFARFGEPTFL